MSGPRLKPLHVYIIGAVVALIIGLGLFFALLSPAQSDVQKLRTQDTDLDSQISANLNAPQEKEAAERAEVGARAAFTQRLRAQSPPPQHVIPVGTYEQRLRQMDRWWSLAPYVLRETVRFARGMPGVRVTTNFSVPNPSPDPNAIPQNTAVVYNMGRMSATGSFKNVMAWARRWNSFKFKNVVDNLRLAISGPSGDVIATASLTVYVFPMLQPGTFVPPSGDAGGGGGDDGGGGGGPMGGSGGGGMDTGTGPSGDPGLGGGSGAPQMSGPSDPGGGGSGAPQMSGPSNMGGGMAPPPGPGPSPGAY